MDPEASIEADASRKLTGCLLRIRGQNPFFGTLALHAEININDRVDTAATDGKNLWFNPGFITELDRSQLAGLVIHELLHMALLHCSRRRERNPRLWNIAADIVVNGEITKETEYTLPDGAIIDAQLAMLSVEEVYEKIQRNPRKFPKTWLLDLLPPDDGPMTNREVQEIEDYWRGAMEKATAIARQVERGFGTQGLGNAREFAELNSPTINWREQLWMYVVNTPVDFSGFDRRFIWQGLYIDDQIGESVNIVVAIDTSGSVSDPELSDFLAEIRGIIDFYPQIEIILYYADTVLYGPYEFGRDSQIPPAKGGGGTDFRPFFKALEKDHDAVELAIYVTDGYGQFPAQAPDADTLWLIASGGTSSADIPFGEVIRLAR